MNLRDTYPLPLERAVLKSQPALDAHMKAFMLETLRVNGQAEVSGDEALVARWDVAGKRPRSVLRVTVAEAFMHCGKALIRSQLWALESQIDRRALASYGQMLKDQTRLPVSAEDIQRSIEDGYATRLY